jgi:hypothetical protein
MPPEQAGFVAVLEDGLNNMGWSDLTHPSMALSSWRTFASRWTRSASASSTADVDHSSTAGNTSNTFLAPWTALMSRWRDDGSTAVQAAAPLAALGVLQALESHGEAVPGLVTELMAKLEHQVETAR